MLDELLYWSKRGEIGCRAHAPSPGSDRWRDEGWQPMPDFGVRMARYQCQHCEGLPIRSFPRSAESPGLILNVDDRPASLYVRTRALKMHGFLVANCDTGEAALLSARRLRPQLVLLDVHLPDIDGRVVCQRLKSDRETASIPVVLISSTLGESGEDVGDLARNQADGYIAEPVAPDELVSAVRRLLKAS